MKHVVVIGMGYVGIPAAVLFADVPGFSVIGIQRKSTRSGWKIDFLNQGRSPFPENEPGIAELIHRVAVDRKTFAVTDSFDVLKNADAVLVDVQTPVEPGDHEPRYESLREVVEEIGKHLKHGALVCVESTVAPGTTTNVVKPLLERSSGMIAGSDFHLCFSYERVMVGRLLHNIVSYPRIVGGYTQACAEKGVALYQMIVKAKVVATDCLTAEVSKTVENAYRDVNIAFANEVALVCESLGIDVFEVRELVNNLPNDPSRPSANPVRNMHLPGAGVGGHCLPKDSWLLKYGVDRYGKSLVEMKVILGSRAVNDSMPIHMADLAEETMRLVGIDLRQARIAILGYAFLEESDDTRNSPSASLIVEFKRRGVQDLRVHDPFVRKEDCSEILRDLSVALTGADCACLMTRHRQYTDLKPEQFIDRMRTPTVIDGRNAFSNWPEGCGVTIRTLGSSRAQD